MEIGGGFRIPDVLRAGGSRLVEVGTTNRTHVRDESARRPGDGRAMRIHSSNFRQLGFVAQPTLAEMAAVAHARTGDGAPAILIDDLGSAALLETTLRPRPRAHGPGESRRRGRHRHLQRRQIAGRAPGRSDRRQGGTDRDHATSSAARALRVDKMTLAALDATLLSYQRGRALVDIPVWQMIGADVADLAQRARTWRSALETACADTTAAFAVEEGESAVGGGSLPGETLPTRLLAVTVPDPELTARRCARRRRRWSAAFNGTRCSLTRTVLPAQEETLLAMSLRPSARRRRRTDSGAAAEEPRHG
ncbi:MAG: hypothetical protein R2838_15205 [Caldilineaceae bacterium]